MSLYIGVYKAVYDYTAQANEELSLVVGDLLYLLEKSDIDDWWKVKKRVLATDDHEVDEPVGLIPANYIEAAPVVKTATALYDYVKQTEEELSFGEGDKFNVFDLNDPDWLLVGDSRNTSFGFIPANYIEIDSASSAVSANGLPRPPNAVNTFSPPPSHPSRQSVEPAEVPQPVTSYSAPQQREEVENLYESEEEAPPMPLRPTTTGPSTAVDKVNASGINDTSRSNSKSNNNNNLEDVEGSQEHSFDGEFFKWYIDEVDGRKKRAVILSIGQGFIVLKPNSKNPKKLSLKSASSLDNSWRVRDLLSFSNEKKHLFLEFKSPTTSIELHTGTKDVADAIVSILGDLKGAETASGLKEVAKASKATTNSKNRKIGRLLYDFEAQGDDELMGREGDEVYVINETKSKDWWMCENVDTKKSGVIPSSYIEIIGTSNLDKLTERDRSKIASSSKGKVIEHQKSGRSDKHRHRNRDEREKIRERDRQQRDKYSETDSKDSDKAMPNYHRVRTWIDSSGSFKVEAEFLGFIDGKIHLHKTNGVKIAVSAVKLALEDLEYVEKVTGNSLAPYKEEVTRQNLKRSKSKSSGVISSGSAHHTSATAAINDTSSSSPHHHSSSSAPKSSTRVNEPDYDWFEFFLSCGVDIGNCQRYSLNFSREQMDENILEDITPSLLRTLGLREGDILRVMKFLDGKYDRKKSSQDSVTAGALFTDPTGALKNNSTSSETSKVNAGALPQASSGSLSVPSPAQDSNTPQRNSKFEDDAWAVKPAARSSEDLSRQQSPAPQAPVTPQYTGALQDLVNIKPLDPNGSSQNLNSSKPAPALPSASSTAPTAPALVPVRTGNLVPVQNTGFIPVQRTGGLVPVQQTGGLLPAQPTGFIPITSQPTGFMPIQATGGAKITYGLIPIQTGSIGIPQTTFGTFQPTIVPLQTGNVTMPQTTFGAPQAAQPVQMSLQRTGPLVAAQRTGGFVPQSTFGQQITGGFMSMPSLAQPQQQPAQTSFGQAPQTSFGQVNAIGGFNGAPNQTTFGGQSTGGFNVAPVQNAFGGQQTGGFNGIPGATSFGGQQTGGFNGVPAPTTFGGQQTGGFNGVPAQNIFGGQATGGFSQPFVAQQPQQQISQQFTQFTQFTQPQPQQQQPLNSFGQFGQPQPQPQQAFNQFTPNFNQSQPNMNQLNNMFQNTNIAPTNTFPNTTFGQPQQQFDGFNSNNAFSPQTLQSQPTGAGFGNAPLQSQATGRRANLQAATADNPFGF